MATEENKHRKSRKSKNPGYLHGFSYQDPLIQQELDNAIGVDDDEIVNITLRPHILHAELPPGFKRPSMKPYDNTIDPKVFLNNFKFLILSRGGSPVHMCKLFPEYLIDSANI